MLLLVFFCASHTYATAFERALFMKEVEEDREAWIAQDDAERKARGVPTAQEQQKARRHRNCAWWKWFAWEVVKEMGSNAPQSKL